MTDPIAPFALRLPSNTRFGRGAALAAVPDILALGQTVLFVHGASAARSAPLREAMEGARIATVACDREPTLPMLIDALAAARAYAVQVVVAMGGGAVLDFGKALAALLPAPSADPLVHLEVVGQGRPLAADPLPFVAIPTTAGTGAEATKNAVIAVPDQARKVSLRDDRMVPDLAVIDPGFTDGTPPAQTLASGLDAVTQVIEPYLSARATPFTDALCRPAIAMGLSALAQILERGEDEGARDRLSYTAYVSGIALANAGLGPVHGLAGVLGGVTGAAHGAICARLLPQALAALRRAAPAGSATQTRLAEVDAMIAAALGIEAGTLDAWVAGHGLGGDAHRLSAAARAQIAADAQGASSMKSTPVALSDAVLCEMLDAAGF